MPLVLCILDGVGIREEQYGNAVKLANMPTFQQLWNQYPHCLLEASGNEVGLPEHQMGNSEVGHMNIGAGRIVYQPLQLINEKIKDGSFYQNQQLKEAIEHAKKNNSHLHLMGLLSDGGIHSHIKHLFALLELCKKENMTNIYIHPILDGRDTKPDIAITYLNQLQQKLDQLGFGVIATISGRYYTMDRDNRWDRVEKAYNVYVNGIGESYETYQQAIASNTERQIADEFIIPAIIDKKGTIKDHDSVIIFNFRPDRLREIGSLFTNPTINPFPHKLLQDIKLVTMFPVSEEVNCTNAYQLQNLQNTLGQYISDHGLKQLRIAETEKYAHVTYFFDGGIEKELPQCKRILIPSPKVATYDLQPEMSAYEVTDTLLKELDNHYDVVILNFANGDMVGHTGDLKATIKALETIDKCLAKIWDKVNSLQGILVVTADHGNSDIMIDEDGNPVTSHTTSKVPFIIGRQGYQLKDGKLGDIAPTLLTLLNLPIPVEMTGDVLLRS